MTAGAGQAVEQPVDTMSASSNIQLGLPGQLFTESATRSLVRMRHLSRKSATCATHENTGYRVHIRSPPLVVHTALSVHVRVHGTAVTLLDTDTNRGT